MYISPYVPIESLSWGEPHLVAWCFARWTQRASLENFAGFQATAVVKQHIGDPETNGEILSGFFDPLQVG